MPPSKQYKLNLPADVKAWVAAMAAKNLRSQSAEIIFALREKMAAGEDFGEAAPAAGNDEAALPGGSI